MYQTKTLYHSKPTLTSDAVRIIPVQYTYEWTVTRLNIQLSQGSAATDLKWSGVGFIPFFSQFIPECKSVMVHKHKGGPAYTVDVQPLN